MVDTENLHAASLYINNQLLSRGLLRDGQNIDFLNLGRGSSGSATETSGQIMRIINDLILRRDRDAEQRESLSTAMRNLRTENLKNTGDIARLTEKSADAQRKLDIATSSEASARTQLKSTEAAMRGLRDELARTKALVAQTRTACATEIRRRDRQIETLKKQVGEAGRARGAKASSAVMTITVTGDVGAEESKPTTHTSGSNDNSLRNETNTFLANLASGLGEENESLLNIIKQTTGQLREMSGFSGEQVQDSEVTREPSWEELAAELDSVMEHLKTILTNPSFVPIEEVVIREEEINRLKAGWVKMESRWEDAVHLMDGWRRRMALSGKPVCEEDLRQGLSLSPVRVVNVVETSGGRKSGLPAVAEDEEEDEEMMHSPCPAPGAKNSMPIEDYQEEEEDVYGESEGEYSENDDAVLTEDPEVQEEDGAAELPETTVPALNPVKGLEPDSSPLPEPPQLSPLKNSSSAGNRGFQNGSTKDKGTIFGSVAEEKPSRDLTGNDESNLFSNRSRPAAQRLRTTKSQQFRERESSTTRSSRLSVDSKVRQSRSREGSAEPGFSRQRIEPAVKSEQPASLRQNPRRPPPRITKSRNSDPNPKQNAPVEMSNITAKLAASEREADAARVRAKLRAARTTTGGVQRPVISSAPEPPPRSADAVKRETPEIEVKNEDGDPVKRDPPLKQEKQPQKQPQELPMEKRKREKRPIKTSSRRRSTLTSMELQTLISGNAE